MTKKAHPVRRKIRTRYQQWEDLSVWPMFILSVVFVVISVVIIARPKELARIDYVHLLSVGGILWLVFIANYVIRMLISENRQRFIRDHSFELASLIVPYLRPFLLLSYVWRLSFFENGSASRLRARYIILVSMFAVFYVYSISTAVWIVERHSPKANILNWGDAIWWGFTTISTVGYGDFTPVTALGRILAVFLMIGGIFVLGVVSATVISAFNDQLKGYLQHHRDEVIQGRAQVQGAPPEPAAPTTTQPPDPS